MGAVNQNEAAAKNKHCVKLRKTYLRLPGNHQQHV